METPVDRFVAAGIADMCRDRCSDFARLQLQRASWPEMQRVLDSDAEEQMWLWSRQTGKSTNAATKLVHKAVYTPSTLGLIISASQRQANRVQRWVTTFMLKLSRKERWQVLAEMDLPSYDPDDQVRITKRSVMSMELSNGSEIISVPASPETVRGYSPNLIVMDEAAWIPDDVYDAVRPMRVMTRAQLISCSSAGARNGWFFREWHNEENDALRSYVRIIDCPIIPDPEKFLEDERKKNIPEFVIDREYMNVFTPLAGAILTEEQREALFTDEEPALVPFQRTSGGTLSSEHPVLLPFQKPPN